MVTIDQSLFCLVFSKYLRQLYKKDFNILSEHNLLYQKQFGFQQLHSMEHAIMLHIDQINNKFKNNCFTSGIFIDLSKSFQTVNHQILISKLKHYQVKVSWFKSYLKNHKQYLSYNNDVTNLTQIKCGIPQGSILGSLLFLFCVNHLRNT